MRIIESFDAYFPSKDFDKEVVIENNDKEEILDKIESLSEENEKVKLNFLEDYYAMIDFKRMTCKIVKETKRSKYGYTKISYYKYRRFSDMAQAIVNVYSNVQSREEYKQKRKEELKQMVHPFEVGDIMYDSWGYEQTNIDFYQVVKTSDKSVWLRPIAGEQVSQTGPFSANVKPIKNEFIGDDVMRKPVKFYKVGGDDGKRNYYVPSKFGSITLYDAGGRGVHSSWGY